MINFKTQLPIQGKVIKVDRVNGSITVRLGENITTTLSLRRIKCSNCPRTHWVVGASPHAVVYCVTHWQKKSA